MSTMTEPITESLPDAALTPAERAWDAIAYMEAHPDEVNLESWGAVHPDDESRTVGCFAHHVVKQAGYEFADLDDGRMYVKVGQGREHLHITAARLLEVEPTTTRCPCGCDTHELFKATGTLTERAALVEKMFGPRPALAG
jgi:hypothetical protein